MERQEVVLYIMPDASMRIEVEGVCGPACKDLTAKVERALGQVTQSSPTDEYYLEQATGRDVHQ